MGLVKVVVDFFTLGILGFCSTITLLIWWGFCDSFIFGQGYFRKLNQYPAVKAIIVIGTGIVIWSIVLMQIHLALWG